MCIRDSFGKFFIFKAAVDAGMWWLALIGILNAFIGLYYYCLLYTSDAADERSSVDLGGRRIIKKKNKTRSTTGRCD